MDTQLFLSGLGILGMVGTLLLLTLTSIVLRYYRQEPGPAYHFRRYWRSIRLKQVAALASLFFLAMAASYMIFLSPWALLYFIAACKTGTWWLRLIITQRI